MLRIAGLFVLSLVCAPCALAATDLTISATGPSTATCTAGVCSSNATSSVLTTADLQAALAGGSVVVNASTGSGSGAGSIDWTDGTVDAGGHSLSLTATTSITFDGTLTNLANLAFSSTSLTGTGSADGTGAITGLGSTAFSLTGTKAGTAGGISFSGFTAADTTTVTGAVYFDDSAKSSLGMTFASAAYVSGDCNITGIGGSFNVDTGVSSASGIQYSGFAFGIDHLVGAGTAATITGTGDMYTLDAADSGHLSGNPMIWSSFPNINDATGTLLFGPSGSASGNVNVATLFYGNSTPVSVNLSGTGTTGIGGTTAGVSKVHNDPGNLNITGTANGALDMFALNVINSSSLTFGNGATAASVTGDYSQTGTLNLHGVPTNVDHLGISGNAALGGTLSVAFSSPPSGGLLAVVLSADGNLTGTFSTFNVTGLAANQTATLIYNAHTVQINVTAAAVITTSAGSAAFIAGDNTASTPVAIDNGLTVTDNGATTLASGSVAITGNFHPGEDVLAFANAGATMGNITASYNATTGVLTLISAGATATLAQWQDALRAVRYTDTAITPDTATRTASFTVADIDGIASNTATRTITVTAVDQTPIVTTTGGTTNYVGGASAVTIDGGITVSDLDNATQSSATVSVTMGFHAGDMLGFINSSNMLFGNIAASYSSATGVMTLTSAGATATNAQWANALSSVTFSSTSSTGGNRTVSFSVNDGTKASAAATDTVNVIVTLSQAITNFIADPANPVFVPGGAGTFTVSATGGNSGNPVTFTSATAPVCTTGGTNGATITMLSPGACTLHADQAGDSLYTAAPQATLNVTIAKATQTVSFTSSAPTNATYGGPAYAVTATTSSNLPVTLAISGASAPVCALSGSSSGSMVTFTAPGTCLIDADQAGDATFAAAPQTTQSFQVGLGVQTLSIAAPTFIYLADGPATLTATASSGLPVTVTSSTPTICSVSGSAPTFSIALLAPGTCTLGVTQTGFPNYASVSQNVSIAVLAPLVPTPMLDRRALLALIALIGLVALARVRRA